MELMTIAQKENLERHEVRDLEALALLRGELKEIGGKLDRLIERRR